ncbi:MAG TPA: hypothetical protein PLT23_12575, partial [Lentisphaeria bacterium]|nr:hypothetical protein [Lentisphaeria bacterium]
MKHVALPTWTGVLEIIVLAVVFYYMFLFFRGTRGMQVLMGFVVAVVVMLVATKIAHLDTLNWL